MRLLGTPATHGSAAVLNHHGASSRQQALEITHRRLDVGGVRGEVTPYTNLFRSRCTVNTVPEEVLMSTACSLTRRSTGTQLQEVATSAGQQQSGPCLLGAAAPDGWELHLASTGPTTATAGQYNRWRSVVRCRSARQRTALAVSGLRQ